MARYVSRGTRPAPDIRLEAERPLTNRTLRTPTHTFRLRIRPWQLVPCAILPVLPGDTLKRGSFKMRVLSKPINDKLSGWWLENYWFYVRFGDLDDAVQADLQDMILHGGALSTSAANTALYHPASKFNWLSEALSRIEIGYFRNEDGIGGNYADKLIGDYPAVKVGGPGGLFDSLAAIGEMDDPTPADADEFLKKWEIYQNIRQSKMTTATWEEYLAASGVALPPQLVQTAANRVPELLHFTRDWQFPVQAVEPSTGVPSALVQWSLADRLKRGRFMAEPGMVVGCVCARPKAYLKYQRGSGMSYLMDDRSAWFDPQMDTEPHNRLRTFDAVTVGGGAGPVWGSSVDYVVDPQDLFSRGDQFTNLDLGSTVAGALAGINIVDLPVVSGNIVNTLYPDSDDADAVFSGTDKWLDVDGVASFGIASRAGRGDVSGKRKGMA